MLGITFPSKYWTTPTVEAEGVKWYPVTGGGADIRSKKPGSRGEDWQPGEQVTTCIKWWLKALQVWLMGWVNTRPSGLEQVRIRVLPEVDPKGAWKISWRKEQVLWIQPRNSACLKKAHRVSWCWRSACNIGAQKLPRLLGGWAASEDTGWDNRNKNRSGVIEPWSCHCKKPASWPNFQFPCVSVSGSEQCWHLSYWPHKWGIVVLGNLLT